MNKEEICIGKRSRKTYSMIQEMARKIEKEINNNWEEKIRTRIKELEDIKNKNIEYCSRDYFQLERTIKVLKELLGDE